MIIVNGSNVEIEITNAATVEVESKVDVIITGGKGNTGPIGPQGPEGLSAYEVAVENGFEGTEAEWLQSLQGGPQGPIGPAGPGGATGPAGPIGPQGIQGPIGPKGDTGDEGDKYHTTSLTTLTIANNGQITLITVDKGLDYSIAQSVIIAYDLTNHMHGQVVSYNEVTGSLVIDLKHKEGSGTYSLWNVNLDGAVGIEGPAGPIGPSGPQGAIGPAGPGGATGPAGPSGPQGAIGPAGPSGPAGTNGTSFIWKGVYDPATTYDKNDVVEYDGSSFICLTDGTLAVTPSSVSENWNLLAQKGDTGATGPQGPAGMPTDNQIIALTLLFG